MSFLIRSRTSCAALLGIASVLLTLPSQAEWRDRDQVLARWEIVALTGRSLTQWGNSWWKFAFDNPEFLSDPDLSSLGDVRGPVFFAQASGGEPFRDRVDVPAGEYMLLPIATFIWTFFDPCAEIRCARELINQNFLNGIEDVFLKIDGRPVKNLAANLVWVDRHNPEVFLVDAGPIGEDGYGGILPALQGGYWAMLEPLSPGQHSVAFGATVPELDPFTGQPTGGTINLFTNLTVRVAACREPRHCHK